MIGLPVYVWVLTLCQILFTTAISIDLTLTSLAGQSLAREPSLVTVPFAMITVGAAVAMPLAGWLMRIKGRKAAFLAGTIAGLIGGSLSAVSLVERSFVGLCCGAALAGSFQASSQFYRLAAADGIEAELRPRVVSLVLAGGVIAAIFGPALAIWSRALLPGSKFAGAYVAVAVLAALSFTILLIGYRPAEQSSKPPPEAVPKIGRMEAFSALRHPIYLTATINSVVAGIVMMLIMTAAPLAVVASGHSIADGADIMRWHLVGMYAPSLVSGALVARMGATSTLFSGLLLSAACIAISTSSSSLIAFYGALFCLGVGWNLSFVASSTLLSAEAPMDERLKAQAMSETLRYALTAIASLAAGILFYAIGWKGLNLAAAPVLVLAALATAWWVLRARGGIETKRLAE